MEALLNGSPEPLLSVTSAGRILSWSRAAELLFAVLRSDAIGRFALPILVRAEGVPEMQRALREAEAGASATARVILRSSSGPLEAPLRVVRDGSAFVISVEGASARLPGGDRGAVAVTTPPVAPAPFPPPVGEPVTRALAEVSRVLAETYDPSIMLRRAASAVVPQLADWLVADFVEPDGSLSRTAFAFGDLTLADLAPAIEGARLARGSTAASARAAREVRMLFLDAPAPEALGLDALAGARLAAKSALVVPIVSRLRTLGALTLASNARSYVAEDSWWAEDLARRIALSIENARLADALQRARQSALESAERARRLQALTRALADALTPAEVAAACVEQGRAALGASGGAVALLAPERTRFEIVGGSGEKHPLLDARRRLALHARLPLSDAARSGEPVLLESGGAMIETYGHEMADQPGFDRGAVAAVPLAADGRAVGALGLHFATARHFTEEDVVFLSQLARQCADALERARLYDAERSSRALADAEARRAAFLADASRILSTSFDLRVTLPAVARIIVPTLADWCAIHLKVGEGRFRTLAAVHALSDKAGIALSLVNEFAPQADGVVAKVVAHGKPELFSQLPGVSLDRSDPARWAVLEALGVTSRLIVPLLVGGRTVGALELAFGHSGRRYQPEQIPLADELGRRIASAIDHSELYHEARDAVKRKEESLALVDTLLRTAPVGFALLDADLKAVRVNDALAALVGVRERDVVGLPVGEALPALPAGLVEGIRELLRTGSPLVDLEIQPVGDRRRHWITSAYPVRASDGALNGVGVVVVDVTVLRSVEEELTAARRQVAMSEKMSALGTLVSGVAHEIRTPLAYIANNLYVMRNRIERAMKGEIPAKDLAASLQEFSHATLEGVDRINKLVTDLRRFTKLKTGERSTAALDEVVSEAINLFRATHRGAIDVEAKLDPVPPMELDRVQIQQIVINLLDNAVDATPSGGRVSVATRPTADGGAIVVADTGVGIPEDVQARMYEPFFTTKLDGTGLGLSIIRRIVELHGGQIGCDSAPGKGTRFTITLTDPRKAPP